MHPPDELMSRVFLPAMRQLVAVQLRSQGMSQSKIASLLGTTQASVSMYLSSNDGKAYRSLSLLSVSRAEADSYSDQLASAAIRGAVHGVRTLNEIWTRLLGEGAVCPAHRDAYPSLSDCDFCVREYGGERGSRSQTIAEVADAVKMLEDSPKFVAVMPEVSVNIACAAGAVATPADVVAVPGRIVRVKDRAKAMLPPEAGASAHMARVLLLARSRRPELRACINLRYDGRMSSVMRKSGLRSLVVGGYSYPDSDDPTVEALGKKLAASKGAFDALADEGGSGIEPNVYLFAEGAREVASLALKLARAYSAR